MDPGLKIAGVTIEKKRDRHVALLLAMTRNKKVEREEKRVQG